MKIGMKKAVLLGILCCLSAPVLALDLEVATGFGGYSNSSDSFADARFYYPINKKMDAVFGVSSQIPGQKYADGTGRQMATSILAGIRTPMPVLGSVDMYFVGADPDGVQRVSSTSSDWKIQKFAVSKQWLYSLNDRVNLGMRIVFAEVLLDGTKQVNVISQVQPVLGVTIRL
jgi:hypothetical protein